MAKIGFLVDSLARIPDELAEQYHIHTIPLRVVFGQESLREQIDISDDEFLRRLKASRTLPTTSQASPGEFIEKYREMAKEFDSIIAVLLSATLSGTISAATQAAKMVEEENIKVSVVDSRSAFMGCGMMALAGARAAAAGSSHVECIALIERMVPIMRVMLVVDSLDNLAKGGRIGGASAILGNMLQVKPILAFRDGRIIPLERVRTKRKAIDRVVDIMAEELGNKPYRAAVGHAAALDDALALGKQIQERLPNFREFHMSTVGPVITTHTGPGTIGLIYYVDES
jgi:DegV family protein with EDD domain